MEVSLALILDELGFATEIRGSEDENPKFETVELFIPGETSFSPEKLLVCQLSEALAADGHEGTYFLCVRDKPIDFDDDIAMKGITVFRGNISLRDLFNQVLRVFSKITKWIITLEKSVSRRNGLKDLLDISEPIFQNFITIQDSTFKLLCYTENIIPPSIVMSRLIKFGYHPPETMELFRKHRRLEQFKMTTDVVINRDKATSKNDIVKKTIHIGGSILIMIVMDCCGRLANNAIVEMFEILVSYIERYAELDIAQTGGIGGVKALAADILEKNVDDIEEARTRAIYCGFPFDNDFRLYVFAFEDDDNVPTTHIIHLLSEVFTDAIVFSWNQDVMLLESITTDISDTCQSVITTLERSDFTCGISNDFNCLWNLPSAHKQAVIAVDVSSRLSDRAPNNIHDHFCMFSASLTYHVISASYRATPEAFKNSFISRSLSILRDYDNRHRTETAKILRVFLENERSATATAAIMHMHRNTVLYHMDKISNLLGLSLDNPDTRLQLLLAYKAADFKEL